MPTLQGGDVPDGKPADAEGDGVPAGAGAGAGQPTGLESWRMEAALLEQVAGAKSWKLCEVQDAWFVTWYEPGAAKPQAQPLGIQVAEVDEATLRLKIRVKVEEERAVLELLGLKPGALTSPAADTPSPAAGMVSPPAGTPARKRTVLSEDCKQDREPKTPDSKGAGKAKLATTAETAEADPVATETAGLARPIDFREVMRILTTEEKTPTREECVAYVHNQLGAEVVEEGSEPAEDRYSVVANCFQIADDQLIGLRVVGIGAVDSSGSRGRYAKVIRVTNARVKVEFEDGKEGHYFTKSKAEPVDVNGLSLVTGQQVFTQTELDEAVRYRQTSRVRNKLDKARKAERKKAPGSAEKEKASELLYKIFAKLQEESDPPAKKRKTGDEEERKTGDEDERMGVAVMATAELRAQALEAGMRSLAHRLVHLTRAGVIPVEAFENFRDELNSE